MHINNSKVRGTQSDLPAALFAGNQAATSNADSAGFASLLRQTQTKASPAPAPAPAPQPATHEPAPHPMAQAAHAPEHQPGHASSSPAKGDPADKPADAGDSAQDDSPATVARAPNQGTRSADGVAASKRNQKSGAAGAAQSQAANETKAADAAADQSKGGAAVDAPIDPNIMQWLAGLQRASVAAGDTSGVKRSAIGKDDGSKSVDDDAKNAPGTERDLRADLKAEADVTDKAPIKDRLSEAAGAGQIAEAFAESLAEHIVPDKLQSTAATAVKDVAAAAAGAFAPMSSGASVREASAPVTVAMATPVTDPDFAQALGLQMSVLARDGVQQAELHLNPAEMGPVSVKIEMIGTQAHVAFGADMAATRQLLTDGLPELASALRDAGFTLAGGGVSQHAGGRSGGESGHSTGQPGQRADGVGLGLDASSDRASASVASAARRIVTKGGVDLFA